MDMAVARAMDMGMACVLDNKTRHITDHHLRGGVIITITIACGVDQDSCAPIPIINAPKAKTTTSIICQTPNPIPICRLRVARRGAQAGNEMSTHARTGRDLGLWKKRREGRDETRFPWSVRI